MINIILFTIIYISIYIINKNIFTSLFVSLLLFSLLYIIMEYRKTIEKFEDLKDEPPIDLQIFQKDEFKKSSDGLQDLLKKVNGGIDLKEDDLKETSILNIDTQKYSDDEKPNALKLAQKETYELINTVNALKDTLSTLAPVLHEGKKLLGMFEK